MRTIPAKIGLIFGLQALARSISFWDRQIVPNFALTTDSHKSIFKLAIIPHVAWETHQHNP